MRVLILSDMEGVSGVEVIAPLKVQSKAADWLAAWDQVWPQADA